MHFPSFFFSKLVNILVCFILKMKKNSFCPREQLQHCSFAKRKESRPVVRLPAVYGKAQTVMTKIDGSSFSYL